MHVRRTVAALAALLLSTVTAVAAAPSAQAVRPTGSLVAVHGIPGVVVDVYVDGALALPDFAPGTITDPIPLPNGTYDIEITPADSETVVLSAEARIRPRQQSTLVAQILPGGELALTPFRDQRVQGRAGSAQVEVRHTADAPAVDVFVDGGLAAGGLASTTSTGAISLPAGTYTVEVRAAGTDLTVFGPADLTFGSGTRTVVYATGTFPDTFGVLVDVLPLGR